MHSRRFIYLVPSLHCKCSSASLFSAEEMHCSGHSLFIVFFTLFTILILFSQLQSEISRLKNEVNQLQGQVHAIAVFLSSILVYLFILVNIIFPFQFLIFMFHTFSVVKKGWGSSGRKSNNWRNVQKRSCRNRSY